MCVGVCQYTMTIIPKRYYKVQHSEHAEQKIYNLAVFLMSFGRYIHNIVLFIFSTILIRPECSGGVQGTRFDVIHACNMCVCDVRSSALYSCF